ncbi:hypothetical protein [Treponema endosymbiont of Eucomonympha sp.]|uniref:hypothetical protein n=1 Tax=Treponema endosymbiont of Eucomonympha sp. TaxID=1580831 RepID=UPI000ACC4963|nr:hypothetical protein [Treponema endosymbiont of Eucomonympha sp.]
MKKNKMFCVGMFGAALVFGFFATGCVTRIMDLTVASTKNIDLSRVGQFKRGARTIKGRDSEIRILGFIRVKTVDMEAAMDKALAKIPGAVALVDFVLSTHRYNFILFQLQGYTVTGVALIDPAIVGYNSGGTASPYLGRFNEAGKITETYELTKEEYEKLTLALNKDI